VPWPEKKKTNNEEVKAQGEEGAVNRH